MSSTETPPNPSAAAPPPDPATQPVKVVTRRFGELDHTELVQLLDSLEGDQAKSRFRESIYISVIIYLALAWFLVYGPRYLFHQGRIVPSVAEQREKDRLTQLDLQRDLAKLNAPKVPKVVPKLDRKALEQLQAMRRANEAARAAQARPRLPDAPQPQPAPAQEARVQPPPPPAATPPPQPRPALPPAPSPAIPDAPRPTFQTPPQNPGQSIADAGKAVVQQRAAGGRISGGAGTRIGEQGAGTGPVEILSDTRGVDFTEYIKHLLRILKAAWYPLIPEECYPPLSKEGTTLIRFTIAKNGQLTDPMVLENSTHDRAIDKAAWGSITSVGQFPPLPAAYTGNVLELRIQFIISRNASSAE